MSESACKLPLERTHPKKARLEDLPDIGHRIEPLDTATKVGGLLRGVDLLGEHWKFQVGHRKGGLLQGLHRYNAAHFAAFAFVKDLQGSRCCLIDAHIYC